PPHREPATLACVSGRRAHPWRPLGSRERGRRGSRGITVSSGSPPIVSAAPRDAAAAGNSPPPAAFGLPLTRAPRERPLPDKACVTASRSLTVCRGTRG